MIGQLFLLWPCRKIPHFFVLSCSFSSSSISVGMQVETRPSQWECELKSDDPLQSSFSLDQDPTNLFHIIATLIRVAVNQRSCSRHAKML